VSVCIFCTFLVIIHCSFYPKLFVAYRFSCGAFGVSSEADTTIIYAVVVNLERLFSFRQVQGRGVVARRKQKQAYNKKRDFFHTIFFAKIQNLAIRNAGKGRKCLHKTKKAYLCNLSFIHSTLKL
jgi:hypothetical protein